MTQQGYPWGVFIAFYVHFIALQAKSALDSHSLHQKAVYRMPRQGVKAAQLMFFFQNIHEYTLMVHPPNKILPILC